MGWPWNDGSSSSSAGSDWRDSGEVEGEDGRRGTRKVVRSRCATEEVEPGKFVRKCEKTEQIFRDCVGRPSELIESRTEHTEEDVTDEMSRGTLSFGSPEFGPFSFPGLRSDIEAIERGMLGGLDTFLQAAEEIKNELFQSFGVPPHYRGPPPYHRQTPLEEPPMRGNLPPGKDPSAYDEFATKIKDV